MAICTLAQFNASTLKASYDAATDKAQVCDWCSSLDCSCFASGETPKQYELTISGLTLCPGRAWPGANLNATWVLTQDAGPNNCLYKLISGVVFNLYLDWGVNDVTRISLYSAGGTPYWFSFTGTETCETSGTGNNLYGVGDCGWPVVAYDGTATWAPKTCS
jgi:hypothetical protein